MRSAPAANRTRHMGFVTCARYSKAMSLTWIRYTNQIQIHELDTQINKNRMKESLFRATSYFADIFIFFILSV